MRVAIWLVGLCGVVACAPDYAQTSFLCRSGERCPDGQSCVGGRCKRGGELGDGVKCGARSCLATEQCCIDATNPPRCVAGGETCPGASAMCDGLEDCAAGDQCCDGDRDAFVTCHASCDTPVCQDDADCPASEPRCCRLRPLVTWGTCLFTCGV